MGIELLLEMAVDAAPERVLLGPVATGLTAADLARLSAAGARRILASGTTGVAFLGVNGPALPVTLFAAIRAGRPITPLNYRLTETALRDQLAALGDPFVVVDSRYAAMVPRTAIKTDDWLAALDQDRSATALAPVADGVAVTLFTSGTTSTPKRVVLRHDHLLSYVLQTVEFASAEPDDATLVSVPPYHVAGIGTILTNLHAGRRLVHLPRFSPEEWVATVRTEGIRHAMLVPTMLARLVDHLVTHPTPLPTLRAIAYGGARIPGITLARALAALPDVDFTNAYGLTETSSTIAVLTPEDHRRGLTSPDPAVRARLHSAGRMVPGVEASIRAPDGTVVPTGSTGELWVRGAQVSGEYVGTGSVLDPDGWFPTRDLAHLDADGYLFVHGRADDTIIRGGENIAPAEIEDVLLQHPDVADVGVVGVPDEEWGHLIRAAVVPRPGTDFDPDELRAWARTRLRGSRTPDQIVVLDELPYTATGKLLRSRLVS